MVGHVYAALGKQRLLVRLPIPILEAAIACARLMPAFSKFTPAMAKRMNEDILFCCLRVSLETATRNHPHPTADRWGLAPSAKGG
jgi:hypothetical protein